MKKIILVVLLLTFKLSLAQSGWFWQNPTPVGTKLNDIAFLNSNTIIAVGSGSVLLKSTDLGISWEVKNIFKLSDKKIDELLNIHVFNETNFVVLASSVSAAPKFRTINVYKTSDGGLSWNKFFVDSLSLPNLLEKIEFIDNNTGFIFNKYRTSTYSVYKTINAGVNWARLSINGNDSLSNLFFLNPNTGWVQKGNSSYFYKTTNAGTTWELKNAGKTFMLPFFINENTGWLENGLGGGIYKTTNGGNFLQTGFFPDYARNIYFHNENTGWCLFWQRGVYTTTNSGLNWITPTMPDGYVLTTNNACFLNTNTGVSAGESGRLLVTSDAGLNWNALSKTIIGYDGVGDISFINENTGWASSVNKLLKSTNGGNIWAIIYPESFYRIKFVNENKGLNTNIDGFGATTNGGVSWNNFTYNTFYFNSISAPSENAYYVYGSSQTKNEHMLLKSTNGGLNWQEKSCPPFFFDRVFFINELTGFFTGYPGTYKTTNGGTDWTLRSTDTSDFSYFINENTGWCTPYKRVKKTTNGGLSWQNQYSSSLNVSIYSLYFSDENTGYMAGSYNSGIILKTTNSGINWIVNDIVTKTQIRAMDFLNANTGWAVGDGGTIIKTTTGGNTIGIQQISTSLPDKFYLSQNYPNPFNPATVISFQLPAAGFVRLKVFDLLGKEVANLVNENLSAGIYRYDFNASALPSGIYFYKLETENFSETRKMVLVK